MAGIPRDTFGIEKHRGNAQRDRACTGMPRENYPEVGPATG